MISITIRIIIINIITYYQYYLDTIIFNVQYS